ncbi:Uncharacterised protein [Escherichia coli]|uniref:Uncharacterized protein n=1 Tax=Escherichia coli HVH 36 (4-5675286) TaxID=1280986 RepID=A0A7U9IXY8_ECOLX|nr:hypothetical protein G711_02854 [Escherichia coli HVH 36 (4-5675286)]CAD6002199.1 Uncharacterised protein [Escherichia coli]CTR29359.1 Uncharacterised protein [Escherichia coli]CTR31484.1 Uncharacterised protein [Escherichia coli]CTR31945.1 Uncharacterised protein [Escherichia coli]
MFNLTNTAKIVVPALALLATGSVSPATLR